MNRMFWLWLTIFCVSAASAINVTNFEAQPAMLGINETVNISADVSSAVSIHIAGFEVRYPNSSSEFVVPGLFYNITRYTMPGPADYPPNITVYSSTYNLTINCKDFSDNSSCYVLGSVSFNNCVNITFDDQPGGGDRDLDIGVIACITETASGYSVNFTRWKYDAGNDVRAMFCLASGYGANFCSNWMLNNSGCGSTANCYVPQITITNLNKTFFGGHYLNFFNKTAQQGTYYLRFFANDTQSNFNNTSTASFSVGEINPPRLLRWELTPTTVNALETVTIAAEMSDESQIAYVEAVIIGAENTTVPLNRIEEGNYIAYYYPPVEGDYYVNLTAGDIFHNTNTTYIGSISASLPVFPPNKLVCKNVTSIGLIDRQQHLSKDKVNALMQTQYYCAKSILGLWGYDFQIVIKYTNSTILSIDGKPIVYGRQPDMTKSIYVSRQTVLLPEELGRKNVVIYLSIWRA